MQTIEMPYGDGFLSASLPDDVLIQQIDAPASVVSQSLDSLLESAMDHPVESQPLDALVKPDDTVVIVVNDHTRPGPNDKIVSAISRCLAAAGVPDDHVTILFATGSHRSPTEEEKRKIVVLRRISACFEPERRYSEREVNDILRPIYDDFVLVRRYLIEYGFLQRTKDCRAYWREQAT